MLIKGLSGADFIAIVEQVSVDHYSGNLAIAEGIRTLNAAGNRFRGRIRAVSSNGEGARRTAAYRRSVAACWHAYRDTLSLLFVRHPLAVVRTTLAAYNGAHGFARNYLPTARTNIGSAFNPTTLTELCECVSYERGPYSDDLDQVLATVDPDSREARTRRIIRHQAPAVAPVSTERPRTVDPGLPDEKPADYLSRTFRDDARYGHEYISRVIAEYDRSGRQFSAFVRDQVAEVPGSAFTHASDESDEDSQCATNTRGCICRTEDDARGRSGVFGDFHSVVWLCRTCTDALHHDEWDPEASHTPLNRLEGLRVEGGIPREAHHEDCPNRCPNNREDVECDCSRIDYSRSWCEGCGNSDHGSREAFSAWEPAPATAGHSAR